MDPRLTVPATDHQTVIQRLLSPQPPSAPEDRDRGDTGRKLAGAIPLSWGDRGRKVPKRPGCP